MEIDVPGLLSQQPRMSMLAAVVIRGAIMHSTIARAVRQCDSCLLNFFLSFYLESKRRFVRPLSAAFTKKSAAQGKILRTIFLPPRAAKQLPGTI
jgi:hypothetical protein